MNKKIISLFLIFVLATVILGCISKTYNSTGASNAIIKNEVPQTIPWSEAKYHIDERLTVYGNVVCTRYASSSNGKPTFLNIGRDYPNSTRFTVVIWGSCRSNFSTSPEVYYRGKTIYVTGLITEYDGVAQIEVCYPYQIKYQ